MTTLLLRDLVEVNQQGMLHNAINFDLMDDPETNLELCKSYIFNYDPKNPTESTLGVFDRLRNTFHSSNEPNVHCTVMQYGKGKSHLSVVIANFFEKPYESPEVQGILHQIKQATVKQPAIGERLESFKKNSLKPYLVVCLRGDWGGINIREHLLKKLIFTYKKANLDCAPLNLCAEPLRYLTEKIQTSPTRQDQANAFLEENGYNYTVESLTRHLQENKTDVIDITIAIYKHLEGFAPNFRDEINVDLILTQTIESYCKGENAAFKGLLIIFDELRAYLDLWKDNPVKAGGNALQEITNVCEKFQGRIGLISFTQMSLELLAQSATDQESFKKISSRLDVNTYEPKSSIELVLDNLLIQKENTEPWQQFATKWRETFSAEARNLYEGSGRRYADLGWSLEDIRRHLSIGCFPLHPYTAYLLANLAFTQDRSAIQFLHRAVVPFIEEQPAETDKGQKPNYVYATALVDNFLANYDLSFQEPYKMALQSLSGSDHEDECLILKALLLYWGSEGALRKKSDLEDHEVLLGHLTGLSGFRLSSALKQLTETYKVIHYNSASKLYRFYQGGLNPKELENEIDELVENQTNSINDVIHYVRLSHFDDKRIPARFFVQEKRQVENDWLFKKEVNSPDSLNRFLSTPHVFQNMKYRGLIIYVLAETQEELQGLRRNITTWLAHSPIGDRVVVAIPNLEIGDLHRYLLKLDTLKKLPHEKRQDYGEAFTQLRTEWERDIKKIIENIIANCTYHCKEIDRLNNQDQRDLDAVISYLLRRLYPFVPPIVDKLKSDHSTGKQIVQFVAKKLLVNDLTDHNIAAIGNSRSAYEDVIKRIYREAWGLLKYQGAKYQAQPPTHSVIAQAWNYIEEQAKQAKDANRALPLITLWKTLSEPPYGYSEYNFVVLLAGWLSYHRRTIDLNGRLNLKGKNVKVDTQPIRDWANSDILDKPHDFVSQWVDTHRAKIIFRVDAVLVPQPLRFPAPWDTAQKYLENLEKCLKAGDLEGSEEAELRREQDRVKQACQEIETWFQPIQDAEKLNPSTTDIVRFIEMLPRLWNAPPSIDVSGRKPSISPSPDQRDRQANVQAKVRDYLAQKLTMDPVTLATLEDCDRRQHQIEQTKQSLDALPQAFPEFLATLEKTLGDIENRRISLNQSTSNPLQSSLEGRIQAFLQRYSSLQMVPLTIQQQALEECRELQQELQTNPNSELLKALEDCGEKIQQHIKAEVEKLSILQDDLMKINRSTDFDRCRQSYDRLAPIFQSSSYESNYQALAIIFDRLNADFKKLSDIQNQVDKTQSIDHGEKLLDKIEQTIAQLNNLQQFTSVIHHLKKQIQGKIETWITQLEQFEEDLQNLKSLEETYKFQAQLLATSDRYQGSAQEHKFNALNVTLRQWFEFFQILENTPSNTLDQCIHKAKELDRWKQQQNQLSTVLLEKCSEHEADLQQEIQNLNQIKVDQAIEWWQNLQQEASQVVTLEGNQRFKMAQEIQKSLDAGWKIHGRFILDKKQDANQLNRQCLKALDEHKVERIKHLFIQLPRPERHQTLQELQEIVNAETEVF